MTQKLKLLWLCRNFAALTTLTIVTSQVRAFPLSSFAVRGTEIPFPFRVRILVNQEKNQAAQVVISGHALRTQTQIFIGEAPLICTYQEDPMRRLRLLKSPLLEGTRFWKCSAPGFNQAIIEPLSLVADGLIHVGKQIFRGAIELRARHEQLLVINEVDVDDYLASVVNKEMRSDYHEEAMKAQIIAARSYALATAADRRKSGNVFDLYATQADQVYEGAQWEDARSIRLVKKTKDYLLFHLGHVLKAYYHSSNGGYCEIPDNVWGIPETEFDRRAFRAGPSPFDQEVELARWRLVLHPGMGKAWPEIGALEDIRVLENTEGQRVRAIKVQGENGTQIWTPGDLRQHLGNDWLKSNLFRVSKESSGLGWLIEGSGWGHGVGLSQLGAQAMAAKGKRFDQILHFYYPSAHIRRIEGLSPPPAEATPLITVPAALAR